MRQYVQASVFENPIRTKAISTEVPYLAVKCSVAPRLPCRLHPSDPPFSLPPGSNINQQALFPETQTSHRKGERKQHLQLREASQDMSQRPELLHSDMF